LTDYVLFSALKLYAGIMAFGIIYNIACQYHVKILSRIAHETFLKHLNIGFPKKTTQYYIDKFHINTHCNHCCKNFSLSTGLGVGRTSASSMEQEWSHIKHIATATRKMGHGGRHQMLDDQWIAWAARLYLDMGKSIFYFFLVLFNRHVQVARF
jgi:hypothetical protein